MRASFAALSVLVLGAWCLGGQARASGSGTERDYEVGAFHRVSVAGPHQVLVRVGGPASVRAVGDAAVLDRLEVRVSDGRLVLGNRDHSGFSWDSHRGKATIYITVPSLSAAAVAGSGGMKIDRVDGDRFEAAVSGSGDLDIASIHVADASFRLAGSGGVRASGTAGKANVAIAGSGNLAAKGLEAADLNLSIAGSGNAQLRATGSAAVSIAGSGNAVIGGGARCKVSTRGSGRVSCIA